MTAWTEKLWGRTRTLHLDARCQLDECQGRAGGASSLHLHRGKHNTFLVVHGIIELSIGDEPFVRLVPGKTATVPALARHRMAFDTDAVLYELYVSAGPQPVDPGDIVRFDEGRAAKQPIHVPRTQETPHVQ